MFSKNDYVLSAQDLSGFSAVPLSGVPVAFVGIEGTAENRISSLSDLSASDFAFIGSVFFSPWSAAPAVEIMEFRVAVLVPLQLTDITVGNR